MMNTMLDNIHAVKGIDPVADFNDTTQSTAVVNMSGFNNVLFVYYKGVGTTGTSTLTVEACDDIVPTNTTAVPFFYKKVTSTDVETALTKATSTGFTTTAGSSQLYLVEVRGGDLASTGYNYVRLKCTEVVNSPVLGGIAILMGCPRAPQDKFPTALV